jgi:geranylgeranyl pyrophosphate synthase
MFEIALIGISVLDDIIDKSVHSGFRRTIPAKYCPTKALLVGDLLIVKVWAKVKKIVAAHRKPEHL